MTKTYAEIDADQVRKSLNLGNMMILQTPEKQKDLFINILQKKKQFTPFIVSGVKKKGQRRLGIK